jgi:hypothetical protein
MIEPDFTLGGFKAALHGPARASHAHGLFRSGILRRLDDVRRQLRRVAHTASHQPPAAPLRLYRLGRMVWTRRCGQSSQTSSLPETASPEA